LIGASAALGAEFLKTALMSGQSSLWKILAIGLVLLILVRVAVRLTTHRGRRLLVSWWQRKLRWEFWSPFFFYPPVVVYVLYLMLKYRSMTLFTASNPAITNGGGFIGESKSQIMRGLAGANGFLAESALIEARLSAEGRMARA